MNIDHDTLIAYAMGTLSELEAQQVEQYLRGNPEAALEVKSYLNALTALVMAEEPSPVPVDAEASLLIRVRAQKEQQVQAEGRSETGARLHQDKPNQVEETNVINLEPSPSRVPSRWGQWGMGVALAAALAVLAWLGPLGSWYQTIQLNQQIAASVKQAGAVSTALVDETNEYLGILVKQKDNSLFVVLNSRPELEQVYQAWNIIDGKPQSLGIYTGQTIEAAGFSEGNIFGITVEPAGGSVQPTTTPIVLYEL